MTTIPVAIIVGSDSDLPIVAETAKILDQFAISYRLTIASAHRSPEKVRATVRQAETAGARVMIAAAGMAAALPGVVAAETVLPVIGVPLDGSALSGVDALYAMAQMPPGIPVGTVAIGKAGAVNAGLLAIAILATTDAELREKLIAYRRKLASAVEEKDHALNADGLAAYLARAVKK
jgi:5-(carboxyamino)imidazole ribonucleotide mutase